VAIQGGKGRASVTTSTGEPRLASEVTVFLKNMYDLNLSIIQDLRPILEKQQGIDLRLYFILHTVDQGTVNPGAIAQAIRLPNSLVTKHLDQLAQKSLLERSIDPSDSRRVLVKLTAKGRQVMDSADAVLAAQVGKRLAKVSPKQRSEFLATLVALANENGGA